MEVLLGLAELDRARPRAAAIGVFDGLHRGHRAMLRRLVHEARRDGALATVVIFDPHPDVILRGAAPPRLGDPQQLLEGLDALGVAEAVVQPFDRALRELDPEAFVRLLGAGQGLRAFVMTAGTAFGRERRGDAPTVSAIGGRLGFRLVLVDPVLVAGRPVSSARVRAAVAAGRLAEARRLMGHTVTVTGHAVAAAGGRGSEPVGAGSEPRSVGIAFPGPVALPPEGTYAVRLAWRHGAGRTSGATWRAGAGVAVLGPGPDLEVRPDEGVGPPDGAAVRLEFVRRRARRPAGATARSGRGPRIW